VGVFEVTTLVFDGEAEERRLPIRPVPPIIVQGGRDDDCIVRGAASKGIHIKKRNMGVVDDVLAKRETWKP